MKIGSWQEKKSAKIARHSLEKPGIRRVNMPTHPLTITGAIVELSFSNLGLYKLDTSQ